MSTNKEALLAWLQELEDPAMLVRLQRLMEESRFQKASSALLPTAPETWIKRFETSFTPPAPDTALPQD